MSTYNTLAHRAIDALAAGDPATDRHVELVLARDAQATGEAVVAAVLDMTTSSAAVLRAQRLLEDEIRRAYAEGDDPLDAALGERSGDRRSAEARHLLALVHRASVRLSAEPPRVDLLARRAAQWNEFIDSHRPADALDLGARPEDAVTDLSGLERGHGVRVIDTRDL